MRHADQEHRVFILLNGGLLNSGARMLFKQIIDVLNAGNRAFSYTIDAFIQPADCRPERYPVVANQATLTESLESLPDRIISNLFHPNIMQLQKIDPIRLQSP